MPRPKLKEKEIQKFILDYLSMNKVGYFWRNNTGAMKGNYKGKGWFVKFGEIGSADIVGVLCGRFVAIECKGEGIRKLSENQEKFRDEIDRNGGYYYLANDLKGFIEWIQELRNILKTCEK